jgi:hypothetical protein
MLKFLRAWECELLIEPERVSYYFLWIRIRIRMQAGQHLRVSNNGHSDKAVKGWWWWRACGYLQYTGPFLTALCAPFAMRRVCLSMSVGRLKPRSAHRAATTAALYRRKQFPLRALTRHLVLATCHPAAAHGRRK